MTEISLCESECPGNAVERDIRAEDRSRNQFVEQNRFFLCIIICLYIYIYIFY